VAVTTAVTLSAAKALLPVRSCTKLRRRPRFTCVDVCLQVQIFQPQVLGAFYACSEMLLGIARRSRSGSQGHDRHSLLVLWVVIGVGVVASILVANHFPLARLQNPLVARAGVILFLAGVILRWYSIIHLGRFFTVNVAIAAGHKVIDSGPYRLLRHPSYSGALLAFIGFGLCLRNWAALLVLLVPITGAFLWRIQVEERALTEALGDDYRSYAARTKRLVPFVY
jgi:protein-S-isoprenylcysteine O-methyltransferase